MQKNFLNKNISFFFPSQYCIVITSEFVRISNVCDYDTVIHGNGIVLNHDMQMLMFII